MEYRRRKRRRRAAAGAQQGQGNGTAKAIIALLVVAAIVYVISASALGTWIAQNVIAPSFTAIDGWFNGIWGEPSPSPNVLLPTDTDKPAANMDTITQEVVFPAVECFALQMGVYSDKSNAQTQAEQLQQRGAGGYVMEDSGRYRVLAAVYETKESLKQVRDQLLAEGVESAEYVFAAQDSTLRITATQEQLDNISACFETFMLLQSDLAASALAFDQQQQTAAAGREQAQKLLTQLKDGCESIMLVSAQNTVLDAVKTCYSACETALSDLSGYQTESFIDFSSKMKYTHISVVYAYDQLARAISVA